jgi:hypothetical protein
MASIENQRRVSRRPARHLDAHASIAAPEERTDGRRIFGVRTREGLVVPICMSVVAGDVRHVDALLSGVSRSSAAG